jgi:hypothetical protein
MGFINNAKTSLRGYEAIANYTGRTCESAWRIHQGLCEFKLTHEIHQPESSIGGTYGASKCPLLML